MNRVPAVPLILGLAGLMPFVWGAVILTFMSGALWAFAMTGGGPETAGRNLIRGFAGLLVLDYAFAHWGLAPPWWMRLRLILTAVAVLCLAAGVYL